MRKLWYAGAAVASGIILFAASPARADEQPSSPQLLPGNSVAPPFGDLLSGAGGYALSGAGGDAVSGARGDALDSVRGAGGSAMSGTGGALTGANDAARQAKNGLDRVRRPTNNLHVTVPLDGSRPLARVRPGSTRDLPPASVIGPLEPRTSFRDYDGLLGGIPLLTGLLPSGRPQWFDDSSPFDERSTAQAESLPLLGGLLPDPGTPGVPGVSGLPAGGMAVLAPAVSSDDKAQPAVTPSVAPSSAAPTAPATPASGAPVPSGAPVDPRLHEEPIDPSERTFSPDGRPVAGVDQQYK